MERTNSSRFAITVSCLVAVLLVGGAIRMSATAVDLAPIEDSAMPVAAPHPAVERLEALTGGEARVALDDRTGLARFVGFGQDGFALETPEQRREGQPARALAFLQAHGGAFGIPDATSQLQFTLEGLNANGTQIEFQQLHRGVPVRDGWVRVYFDHDADLIAVDAHILAGLSVDTTPGIDVRAARSLAIDSVSRELSRESSFSPGRLQASDGKLVVQRTASGRDHLAYEIEISAGQEADRRVMIDSHDGQIVSDAGVEKTVSQPLETKTVTVGGTFSTVTLSNTYSDPVVVCTAQYQINMFPIVTRVRNVGATSFEVRLQNPGGAVTPAAETVHCLIAESGTHTYDGHVIQATHYTSTVTDRKGSWAGQLQTYGAGFSNPVVIGQVMTQNDPNWSVFWAKGGTYRATPPSATTLFTGKMVAEDTDTTRLDEEVGFIVFDAAHGMIGGVEFEAGRGPKTLSGVVNGAPHIYTYDTAFPAPPDVAVSSMAGVVGGDGGWSQLHASSPSTTATTLQLSIDEDQIGDPERSHGLEQAAYAVFAQEVVFPVVAPQDCPGGLNSECDDGLFCNGQELCSGTTCQPSTGDPCAGAGQLCDEDTNSCVTGPALRMETFALAGIDGSFQTVPTFHTYVSPVVVCDAEYETNSKPIVVRLRNVNANGFEIKLQNPSGGPVSAEDVWCIVMEEGKWTQNGVKFEAQRYVSTVTDRKGLWTGAVQAYLQPYTTPTVIGQVMSHNDPAFSVYWQQGDTRSNPPTATALKNGKTVLEDTDKTRVDETVGFIVFEAGHGPFLGSTYEAATGTDSVFGAVNGAPFPYIFNAPFGTTPDFGVTTMSGVDGGDGGWSQRHATSPSATPTRLFVSVDEDQVGDAERSHTSEQLSYLVFEDLIAFPPVAGCNANSDCPGFADFCDGPDTCNNGACVKGPAPCGGGQTCNEALDVCEGPSAKIETLLETNVGGPTNKRTVNLTNAYDSPVVVCSVKYVTNTLPVVPRVRVIDGSSFELFLQNPSGAPPMPDDVYCLVVEEGTWDVGGTLFEAQKYSATITDHDPTWLGAAQSFGNSYTNPVIVGQVMSTNNTLWSVYWQSGSVRSDPPNNGFLRNGKSVLEDPNTVRLDEEVGFIVFERGPGTLDVFNFEAFLTADVVRSVASAPPYTHPLTGFTADPAFAVVSGAGVDGIDGYWPYLFGANPIRQTAIDLAVDEDQLENAERVHTTEQIMGVVFEDLFAFVDNQPPVAQDDDFTTDEDTALVGGDVTADNGNGVDSDPDADPFDVTLVNGGAFTSGVPFALPSGALLTMNTNGAFDYDPNGQFEGLNAGQDDTDSFTYTIEDPGGLSDTATVTITIDGINDEPTATNLSQTKGYTEDDASVALDDIVVTDPDDTAITVVLTLNNTATGSLTAGSGNGETYTPGTGVWTITGTVPAVNAALAAVAFTPALNNDVDTTITTHVEDAAPSGPADGSIALNVTPVNDPPAATNLTQTQGYTEDDATVALDDIVVTDPDDTMVTAVLTLNNTATGSLTAGSGNGETYTPGTGVWTITGTLPAVNAALAAVAFTPALNNDVNTTITTHVEDDEPSGPADGSIALNVTAVNDPPTVTVNTGITLDEDGTETIDTTELDSSDPDDSGTGLTWTLTSGPANGQVKVSGVVAASFTQSDLDSNLVTYVHDGSETTVDSFDFSLADGGEDGAAAATGTFNITIDPINDPPTVSVNTGITVDEGGTETIDTTELDEGDPDDGGTGLTWTITSGPSNGQVKVSGVAAGSFTQSDLDGNLVTYVHDGSETTSDSFNFSLADGGEDGAAAVTGTFNITVNPVNDPPTGAADAFDFVGNTLLLVDKTTSGGAEILASTTGGTTAAADGVLDNDSDGEGDTVVVGGIVGCADITAPFTDCPSANGGKVTMESGGKFSYAPAAGDNLASDSFQYIPNDGTDDGAATTVTLNRKNRVWYVRNDTAGLDLGTSTDPFDALADAEAASIAGDTLFVFEGDGTTTGQNAGITLKTQQRLLGEGVALTVPDTVNGVVGPTLFSAGLRPFVEHATAASDAVTVNATAGDRVDIEIRGLKLSGARNMVDVTAAGAFQVGVTMTDNAFRDSGNEGIDLNPGSSGPFDVTFDDNIFAITSATGNAFDLTTTASAGIVELAFNNNSNITSSAGTAVNINGSAGGSVFIKGFSGNSVHGNTGGTGINILAATFDSNPADPDFDLVSAGTTTVGDAGNPVGTSGMILGSGAATVRGNLGFAQLDIFNAAGTGLRVDGSGVSTGGSPPTAGFLLTVTTGTIASTGGPAVDLDPFTGNMTFDTISSTSSTGLGVAINSFSGSFTVNTSTTVTDPLSAGILVEDSASGSSISFGSTTVSRGSGIAGSGRALDLISNTGSTINFSPLNAVSWLTAAAGGAGLDARSGGTVNLGGTVTIDAEGGPAVKLDGVATSTSWSFGNLTSTNSSTDGIKLVSLTENFAVTGTTDIDGPAIDGIFISGGSANFSFPNAFITGPGGDGIEVDGTTGDVTFTTVDIDLPGEDGIDLKNYAGLAPDNFTISGGTIDDPTLAGVRIASATSQVNLGSLTIDDTGAEGVAISGSSGTINVTNTTIGETTGSGTTTAGNALDIDGGAGTVTVNGSIVNTSAHSVDVTNRTGGSVNIGSSIDDDATGVNLVGNSGTVNLSGGMTLDTGSNTAFNATGGGTVNVTGANRIGSGTALSTTAVNIQGTTLGGSGVTFQDVNVSGGTVGIDIDGGGTTGSFTITGVGTTDGSGGTITNTTQNGILIENTDNISISNMNLTSAADNGAGGGTCNETVFTGCNAALELDTVKVVDLVNLSITGFEDHGIFGQDVTDLDISNTDIDGVGADVRSDEHAIFIFNLRGTATALQDSVFDNVTIDDAQDTAIRIQNTAGGATEDLLTVKNSNFTDAGDSGLNVITSGLAANLNVVATLNTITNTVDGVSLEARAGDLQGTIGGGTMAVPLGNTIGPGAGDMVNGIRFFTSASVDDATIDATASRNAITLDSAPSVSGLNGIGVSAGGKSQGNLGTIRATVDHNTINSTFSGNVTQAVSGVITTNEGTGSISQNVISIDTNTITLNPPTGTGTAVTVGVRVPSGVADSASTVRVTNNTIVANGDDTNGRSVGIQILPTEALVDLPNENQRICVRITGNNVSTPNNPFAAFFGTTELDVIAAPVQAGSFLDVEGITLGVRTPAQLVTDLEPLNSPPNTEVGDATGSISGTITGVTSCPN